MSEQDAGTPAPEPDEIDKLAAALEPGEPEENAEPEEVEIEVGPKKFKLKMDDYGKSIREAWDGMQGAHTQRSQSVAEKEREIQTRASEIAEQQKFLGAFTKEIAELRSVTSELETYRAYTPAQWAQWAAQDEETTNKHMARFRALEAQEKTLSDGIRTRAQEADAREKLNRETRQAKMAAELQTAIKDWSPAKMQELRTYAITQNNIPAEIVDSIEHAGIVKMAHKAFMFDQVMARAAKAAKPASNIVPIAPPKGGGGNSRASQDISDRDSDAEWLRKRNAQEAKARGRK